MAGVAAHLALFAPEVVVHAVRQLLSDREQRLAAGGLMVGDGRLDHVPGAVELMVVAQVCKTLVKPVDDVVGIQVPIRLLGAGDEGDELLERLLQLRVGMVLQAEAGRLYPFGKVAVLENIAAELPLFQPGRHLEIVDTVARFRTRDAVV